jgi:DnaJ family protein A protein 2
MNGGFPFGNMGGMDEDDFGGFGGFGGGQGGAPKKDVNTTRFYELLEVPKTASQDDIRKSYRKKATKMHPDKGGDKDAFQDLQHAYEVLSDDGKRKIYDQYGEEGLKEGRDGSEGIDIFDLINGGGGRGGAKVKRKTKPILHQLKVTLEDVYKGNKKYLEISRYRNCDSCKGSGSKDPNVKDTKCGGCQGKGMKTVVRQMGRGQYLQQTIHCPDCNGEGSVLKEKDKCTKCKGNKVSQVTKTLAIDIDKGANDGKRYTFAGESDEMPGVDAGDVIVEINVDKHKKFIRKGADLVYTADISLLEALTGFELTIEHLDKRIVQLNSKPGMIIKPGLLKTVHECGMPFFDRPFKFGNLYIAFNIVFPDKLDASQKENLGKLFPDLIQPEIKEKCDETYTLSEYNPHDENTHHSGGKAEHRGQEGEDEEMGGGRGGIPQGMGCANQ